MRKLSIVNRSLKNGKEFNEEKRILKQSTFIQEIAAIMNDPLSMTILNDLYNVSRASRRNLLILDTTCKYEKNERTGSFEWIDYPQVKIKNQGKVDIINVKDLVFAEDHIIVSGFKYSFNDIIITKKYLHYYNLIEETPEELKYEYMYIDEKKIHNIINGHTNRVHVSTLMQFYYYCNDCHTWTDLRDYINYINYFDRTITCPSCGATHHFNDIKFVDVFECIPVYSNIFINKNKRIIEGRLSNAADACRMIDILNGEAQGDYFGFCFDIGHANLTNRNVKEFVKELGARLTIMHLHDNDANQDLHMIPYTYLSSPSTHVCDWQGFIEGLKEIEYKGVICFETFRIFSVFPPAVHEQVLKLISAIGRYWADFIEEKN